MPFLLNLRKQYKVHGLLGHIVEFNEECIHGGIEMLHISCLHVESCVNFRICKVTVYKFAEMQVRNLEYVLRI